MPAAEPAPVRTAVVAVEDVGADLGPRERRLQAVGVAPVGRALTPVEQAGGAEGEDARAVRVEDRPALVGSADRLEHGVVVGVEVAVGREADQVGVQRRLEAPVDVQVEVGAGAHPARARRADPEVEDRVVVLGVVALPPDLDEAAEPERLRAVLHDDGHGLHGVGHPAIVPRTWQ